MARGLTRLVRKSIEIGEYCGFIINGRCEIDIIQFADDTLLVVEGSWKRVWAIKLVLKSLELVSRLDINYHNSKLIGINTSSNFVEVATYVLSCKVEASNFTFLGIPIGANLRKYSTWTPLIE